MTMTDTIMFVKETRTCEYVLVIHTPRLCGEPGFKSQLDQVPETEIQCREVLNDDGPDSSSSSSSDEQEQDKFKHPFRRIPRPPPLPLTKHGEQGGSDKKGSGANDDNGNKNNKGFDAQFNMLFQKLLGDMVDKAFNLGDEFDLEGQDIDVIEGEGDEVGGLKVIAAVVLDSVKGQSTESQDDELSGDGSTEKIGLDKKKLGKILREFGYETRWDDDGDDEATEHSTNEDKTHDEL